MGVDLLSVAIVLASCALAVAVAIGISEANEAHDIAHDGWARGHRQHRVLGTRREVLNTRRARLLDR